MVHTFADPWFEIYYGIVSKKVGISKRNLVQMQYSNHGNILPEECYITLEIIEKIDNILNRKKNGRN